MTITTYGEFPMKVGDVLVVKHPGGTLQRIRVKREIKKADHMLVHDAITEAVKLPAKVHGSARFA